MAEIYGNAPSAHGMEHGHKKAAMGGISIAVLVILAIIVAYLLLR